MNYQLKDIKNFFISHEPMLSSDEKRVMWKNIIRSARLSPTHGNIRLKPLFIGVAAAGVALLVIGGALLYMNRNHNSMESDLTLLDVAKCNNTTIVFGNNTLMFGRRCTVKCLPQQNMVEITDGTSHISLKNEDMKNAGKSLAIAVPTQSRAHIILSDGTVITMREGSKMTFPFDVANAKLREVSIDGEAYFSVHHKATSSFTAMGRGLTVKDLGTEFLLSTYSRNAERRVTLISGVVSAMTELGNHVILKPGETFAYNTLTRHTTVKTEQDVKKLTDWKDDIINLDGHTLNVILQQISKAYNVRFHFVDNNVRDICLSGKLDARLPINELLENLSKIAPINIIKKSENSYNIITKK
jgi:transmembrane sensor